MTNTQYTFHPRMVQKIREWKSHIKNQIEHKLILPRATGNRYAAKFWVMGGSFSSHYFDRNINDYDVFLIKKPGYSIAFDTQLANMQNNAGLVKSSSYNTSDKNKNIIGVFKDPISNIQYIFTEYDSREAILKDFDMLHCCVSYDFEDEKFHISPAVAEAIENKHIIQNSKKEIHPGRIRKMQNVGWTLPEHQQNVQNQPMVVMDEKGTVKVRLEKEKRDTYTTYTKTEIDAWAKKLLKEMEEATYKSLVHKLGTS